MSQDPREHLIVDALYRVVKFEVTELAEAALGEIIQERDHLREELEARAGLGGVRYCRGLTGSLLAAMNAGGDWTADLLLDHLSQRGETRSKNVVSATLSRLVSEGKVRRVRWGVYRIFADSSAEGGAGTLGDGGVRAAHGDDGAAPPSPSVTGTAAPGRSGGGACLSLPGSPTPDQAAG